MLHSALLALLLIGCAGSPKGKPAPADKVCEKMENCDYRYDLVEECDDQLLEGGETCRDPEDYLRCIRPCLDDTCADFEYCEFDCYQQFCQ
jgi:hypothetical protein